jgi:lipopolysaccharide/colanic/teichoic acid biosynthesis glycosyltransferase
LPAKIFVRRRIDFRLTPDPDFNERLVDIVGASIELIVLLPMLSTTAIAIKLSSRGFMPFRQRAPD